MADPYLSHDGTVYTDRNIFHPTSEFCTHEGSHACPTCDFDGFYAARFPEVCPWARAAEGVSDRG